MRNEIITIKINSGQRFQLEALSHMEGKSISDIVREAIDSMVVQRMECD